jgi:serralysin
MNSGNYEVNCLLAGTNDGVMANSERWNNGTPYGTPTTITYSFLQSIPSYDNGYRNIHSFNDVMKSCARQALATWASAANITFVEVSDAGDGGQIRFATADLDSRSSGEGHYPGDGIGGDLFLQNSMSETSSPTPGTYQYETLLHEIGHTLGLKHPGNYNATGGGSPGPYLPSWEDNTSRTVMSYTESGSNKTQLGDLDKLAIAYLYGPKSAQTIGNMRSLGSGNDSALGDDYDNILIGDEGNDTLIGGNGWDGIICGTGNDYGQGDDGNDYLQGNMGNDTVLGGNQDDTVRGGRGSDSVCGDNGNDNVYGDADNDTVHGNAGDDTIHGGKEHDLLFGEGGNDQLWGDLGDDTMWGGSGRDYFYFGENSGEDYIKDYSQSEGDWIVIKKGVSGFNSAADIKNKTYNYNGGCWIDFGDYKWVIIETADRDHVNLTVSNF